jgi:hypothetical protein
MDSVDNESQIRALMDQITLNGAEFRKVLVENQALIELNKQLKLQNDALTQRLEKILSSKKYKFLKFLAKFKP